MTLHIQHLSAAYRGRPVLEEVSFSLAEGGITALIGRNGAGKTTLVRCLTGEKRDYKGSILLNGEELRSLSHTRRACTLACLPQTLPQPHITVEELVCFGRAPHTPLTGTLSPADRDKARWAIHAAGMEPFARRFVDELSGGERKKAFFAMTLAQDTPIVVLDEPTAHLDAVSRFAFLDLVQALRRETGKTFLVVMHELPEVLRCADRIVALRDTGVDFVGTPEECLAQDVPRRCFQVQIHGDREHGFAVTPL